MEGPGVGRWRHRLQKFLDRHGCLYVTGKNWSRHHWAWIHSQHFDLPPLQRTVEATLFALERALAWLADRDKDITALAETEPYGTPVGWLRCFRGIATLSAMILVAEIMDFRRFLHLVNSRLIWAWSLWLSPHEGTIADDQCARPPGVRSWLGHTLEGTVTAS